MTDSTTLNSGTRQKQRRASDQPRAAAKQSSFNPLHPSMELPPEQLIRLLGLESKKIRKPKRAQTAPVRTNSKAKPKPKATASLPAEPASTEPTPKAIATPTAPTARSTHRQMEYERFKTGDSSRRRRSLWIPALAVGLVCGIAASAYLFWLPSENAATTQTPAAATSKVKPGPVSSSSKKSTAKAPTAATKAKPAAAVKKDPAWLATIEAQAKRLKTEAMQRFNQQLEQAPQAKTVTAVTPEAAAVITAPVRPTQDSIDRTPLTATAEPAPTEPVALTPPPAEVLQAEDIDTSELIKTPESSPVTEPVNAATDPIPAPVSDPIEQVDQPENADVPMPAKATSTDASNNVAETPSQQNVSELF